jgi:hypothetical protein
LIVLGVLGALAIVAGILIVALRDEGSPPEPATTTTIPATTTIAVTTTTTPVTTALPITTPPTTPHS